MVQITTTTQLSTFSLLRTVLLADSTIGARFKTADFYEIEPLHKSSGFKGFPYIWIRTPSTSTEFITMTHADTDKTFESEIIVRMDYMARANFITYANAIVSAIEAATSTFEASGYFNHHIEFNGVDVVTIDSKDCVEGRFMFTCSGFVDR